MLLFIDGLIVRLERIWKIDDEQKTLHCTAPVIHLQSQYKRSLRKILRLTDFMSNISDT